MFSSQVASLGLICTCHLVLSFTFTSGTGTPEQSLFKHVFAQIGLLANFYSINQIWFSNPSPYSLPCSCSFHLSPIQCKLHEAGQEHNTGQKPVVTCLSPRLGLFRSNLHCSSCFIFHFTGQCCNMFIRQIGLLANVAVLLPFLNNKVSIPKLWLTTRA